MPETEFSIIARHFSSLGRGPGVVLGVGDDCAILQLSAEEQLAISVDTLVSDVHFPADAFPEDIGFRAVAVAVSDLAAMGARPLGMTLALTIPESEDFWLHSFSEGLAAAVSAFEIPLVGGDTTRGPLTISVTVMGALPGSGGLLRQGAAIGDAVYVSGTLGDAAGALAFLQDRWLPAPEHGEFLLTRFYRPQPRISLGKELLGRATAAVDLSDGLVADAGHIAAASGVAIQIDPALLPLSFALRSHDSHEQVLQWALSGGDDYELCFTLPAHLSAPEGCTRIGRVVPGDGVDCGMKVDSSGGYRHF